MTPSHGKLTLEPDSPAPSDRIMAAAAALFAVATRLGRHMAMSSPVRLVVAEHPSGAPAVVEVNTERGTVSFDDGMIVVLAGQQHTATIHGEFYIKNGSLPLSVRGRLGKFVVSIWGDEVVFTVRSQRAAELALIRPTPSSCEDDAQLLAPLPGLLLEMTAAEGMRVGKGRTVAVLEAMKMESRLSLPRDAVITQVLAQPGELVAAAAPILHYRPLESDAGASG